MLMLIANRFFKFREKKLEVEAMNAAEKAAQYARGRPSSSSACACWSRSSRTAARRPRHRSKRCAMRQARHGASRCRAATRRLDRRAGASRPYQYFAGKRAPAAMNGPEFVITIIVITFVFVLLRQRMNVRHRWERPENDEREERGKCAAARSMSTVAGPHPGARADRDRSRRRDGGADRSAARPRRIYRRRTSQWTAARSPPS